MKEKSIKRFWSKVEKTDTCWLWTGYKHNQGYGIVRLNGNIVRAHRVSYFLEHGIIPEGLHICHHCDNPSCVNPSHLFAGTHKDNMQDKVNKGRCNAVYGEKHHKASLTEEQVLEIRAIKNINQTEIAKLYGIHFNVVSSIILRKSWRHI